jgi:hypothetical protein
MRVRHWVTATWNPFGISMLSPDVLFSLKKGGYIQIREKLLKKTWCFWIQVLGMIIL